MRNLGIILCFSLLIACSKDITSNQKGDYIKLVNKNEVTQDMEQYVIYSTGNVLKQASKKDAIVELKNLEKTAVDRLFDNYSSFGIDTMSINAPGKTESQILEVNIKGKKNKFVWGDDITKPNGTLKIFYNFVKRSVKDLNNK